MDVPRIDGALPGACQAAQPLTASTCHLAFVCFMPCQFMGPVFMGPVFMGPVFMGPMFMGPMFMGPVFTFGQCLNQL